MYSKYILNSNWMPLSGKYNFDGDVSLKNQKICVDGNLDINYLPFLTLSKDYTNNNYSFLFLTNPQTLSDVIDIKKINSDLKSQTCLIVSNYDNNQIIDETAFFSLSSNSYVFKNVNELNETCFLEFFILNENEILLYRLEKNVFFYFSIDPFTEKIFTLSTFKAPIEFTDYEKEKIKLQYAYYAKKKSITFFRYIQNKYLYFNNEDNVLNLKITIAEDFSDKKILFTLLNVTDLPSIIPTLNWISYKQGTNLDNLTIDINRGAQNLKNSFLFNFEPGYTSDKFSLNVLTLKNQVTYTDNVIRNSKKENTFRAYQSLYCGGNREHGYSNINLGYTSDHTILNFPPDKTTWFHLPNVKERLIININDTNFIENGAIAGSSPLYSDKIWKKNAGYSYSSNHGESSFKEHTGQWLCAWLSGGDSGGVWMNRFYNPDIFTPFEAIKYTSNVEYRPQFFNKFSTGIVDVPSDILIETGGWYAYSRIGIKTAKKIVEGLSDKLIFKDLSVFKNSNENDLYFEIDSTGDASYSFRDDSYGIIPIDQYKDNYNNFTLSFFGSRNDWNVSREHQLLGNYLNEGFGFFNCEDINPLVYHYDNNLTKIIFSNNELIPILEIDLTDYLPVDQSIIAGVFYTNVLENFFIITKRGRLLEFTSNGTLVDILSVVKEEQVEVTSCSNNSKFGVLDLTNFTCIKIDLSNKNYSEIKHRDIVQFNILENGKTRVFIDNSDRLYLTAGGSPIIKNDRIYYYDRISNSVDFFSIENGSITNYLTGFSEKIVDINFDSMGNTYVLHNSSLNIYNALGIFEKNIHLNISNNLSATNIGISKIDDVNTTFIMFEGKNSIHFYDINKNTTKKINLIALQSLENNYDFCFDKFLQSTKRNIIRLPIYKFKLKLKELVDTEKYTILESVILGEQLGHGEHHFVVTLDTIQGEFCVYIDKKLYMKKTFTPAKYSFSNVLKENFMVGTNPFYGNITYNTFYKTLDKNFYAQDLILKNIKFYNKALTRDEVSMLFLEKKGTTPLSTFIKTGDRSFIDTIVRTFKNKIPGKKTNLINLYISNTKISDLSLQQMYNNIIIKELKNILPGYVKINKIVWLDNKRGAERMLEGYFNRKNTLTEN